MDKVIDVRIGIFWSWCENPYMWDSCFVLEEALWNAEIVSKRNNNPLWVCECLCACVYMVILWDFDDVYLKLNVKGLCPSRNYAYESIIGTAFSYVLEIDCKFLLHV
jgi:hypothetical protein